MGDLYIYTKSSGLPHVVRLEGAVSSLFFIRLRRSLKITLDTQREQGTREPLQAADKRLGRATCPLTKTMCVARNHWTRNTSQHSQERMVQAPENDFKHWSFLLAFDQMVTTLNKIPCCRSMSAVAKGCQGAS